MKFFVDAQLPPALSRWLEDRGHQAEHVFHTHPGDTPDLAIVDYVAANDFILVTKDDDFLTLRLQDRFCLLWLRCGNATNKALTAWLELRWSEVEKLLKAGERLVEVR